MTKARDLRVKTVDELRAMAAELAREHFNLRFQRANGMLEKPLRLRFVRRELARVKTLLAEKERAKAVGQKG